MNSMMFPAVRFSARVEGLFRGPFGKKGDAQADATFQDVWETFQDPAVKAHFHDPDDGVVIRVSHHMQRDGNYVNISPYYQEIKHVEGAWGYSVPAGQLKAHKQEFIESLNRDAVIFEALNLIDEQFKALNQQIPALKLGLKDFRNDYQDVSLGVNTREAARLILKLFQDPEVQEAMNAFPAYFSGGCQIHHSRSREDFLITSAPLPDDLARQEFPVPAKVTVGLGVKNYYSEIELNNYLRRAGTDASQPGEIEFTFKALRDDFDGVKRQVLEKVQFWNKIIAERIDERGDYTYP